MSCFVSVKSKKLNKNNFIWTKIDSYVIISIIIFTLLLLIPSGITKGKFRGLALPPGGDMSNHFFIANEMSKSGKYLYFDKKLDSYIPSGLQNYPQGVHYNFTFLNGSYSYQNNVNNLLERYQVYYLIVFILLFAIFINISLEVLARKLNMAEATIILLLGSEIFLSSLFGSIYLEGFISQIFCLFMLLMLGSVVYSNNGFNSKLWIAIILFFNISIASTWYFMSPIAFFISAYVIIGSKIKHRMVITVFLSLAILICSIPSLLGGSLTNINAAGGIEPIYNIYLLLFVSATIFMVWRHKNTNINIVPNYLKIFVICTLFCLLLGFYQLVKTGSVTYYFQKSLFTPALILAIFYGPCLVEILRLSKDYYKKVNEKIYLASFSLAITILFSFLIIFRFDYNQINFGLLVKNNYMSFQDLKTIETISRIHKDDGKALAFINTGSALNDYVYSKWSTAFNLNFTKDFGSMLDNDINLSDKYRRLQKSDILGPSDISIPNDRIELIDFKTGKIVK